jgi:hypothetical protein
MNLEHLSALEAYHSNSYEPFLTNGCIKTPCASAHCVELGLGEVARFPLIQLLHHSYLVDPASSHMLVSKIKPCMSKYKHPYTAKLRTAHYISNYLFEGHLLHG